MSFIREIEPDAAEGALKEVYQEIMGNRNGRLPPVMKVLGLKPELLNRLEKLNGTISFGGSSLGRRREEMIATLVSALNECHY